MTERPRILGPRAQRALIYDIKGNLVELFLNWYVRQGLTLNGRRVYLQDWSVRDTNVELYMDEKFAECILFSREEFARFDDSIPWKVKDGVWSTTISNFQVHMTPLHQESDDWSHWVVSLEEGDVVTNSHEFIGGKGIKDSFYVALEWIKGKIS